MEIQFIVVGIPKPQARPKVFHKTLKSGRPFVHTYSPKSDWFNIVYSKALEEKEKLKIRLSGALRLVLEFQMPIPKSMSKKQRAKTFFVSKRPDLDNLTKCVMDAINQVGLWEDDSQVSILDASKVYGEEPKCIIKIMELKNGN